MIPLMNYRKKLIEVALPLDPKGKGSGVILTALEPSFEAGPEGGWIRLIPQENDSRPLFFAFA